MGFNLQSSSRYDSKKISLFSIFLAMIIALEILPIIGFTDIPIPGTEFTIDPTGIPIVLIFLFFGFILSFVGVCIMGVVIGYRNFTGSVFKFFAELFKILGLFTVWWILRKKQVSYSVRILLYTIFASVYCAIGMYVMNGFVLLPLLYGMELSPALTLSLTFVPLNIIQSIINVVIGGFIFGIIPDDLRNEFRSVESQDEDIELDDGQEWQN